MKRVHPTGTQRISIHSGDVDGARYTRSERFAHHLFALAPERVCVCNVECIAANALADGRNDHIVRNDFAHVTVFAIAASNVFRCCHHRSPYRSRRTLWDRLELKRSFSLHW
jgi:spore coat polysaccharide biosynthesis protein SpsF (cytidylyltransferase family)